MAAYVVFAVTNVTDLEQLQEYRRQAVELIERTPEVRFFAGPATESLEGPPIALTVVAEMADMDAAKRWYHSDEYQKLARIRMGATEGFGFIVESWSGFPA